MTTILLAGMLGFLIILTVALTLLRAAVKRNPCADFHTPR